MQIYNGSIIYGLNNGNVLVSDNLKNKWDQIESKGLSNRYTYTFGIDSEGYLYQSGYSGFYDWFEPGLHRSVSPINLPTDVEHLENMIIDQYSLSQNYPNPFNPSTTIKYTIPNSSAEFHSAIKHVTLKVYDILGSEMQTLVNENQSPGEYQVEFDAASDGLNLSSGIYFYRMQVNDPSTGLSAEKAGSGQSFVETKKMLLLR
jgi:hypothetical protein